MRHTSFFDSSYISIHTLRMEGDIWQCVSGRERYISIHTLRMEGDGKHLDLPVFFDQISIHTLRMEGDLSYVGSRWAKLHFNPHPPHGG